MSELPSLVMDFELFLSDYQDTICNNSALLPEDVVMFETYNFLLGLLRLQRPTVSVCGAGGCEATVVGSSEDAVCTLLFSGQDTQLINAVIDLRCSFSHVQPRCQVRVHSIV